MSLLLAGLLDPQPRDRICDPACGGGSLLVKGANRMGIVADDFNTDPAAWQGITWGLVAGFVQWMLKESYATGSVNVRLSTVKT